jgi:hypothetical protein
MVAIWGGKGLERWHFAPFVSSEICYAHVHTKFIRMEVKVVAGHCIFEASHRFVQFTLQSPEELFEKERYGHVSLIRRKTRVTPRRIGSNTQRENGGDRYTDSPMRSGRMA